MRADRGIAEALSGSWRYLAHSTYLSAKGYMIRRLRAGRAFHRVLKELEESQWYSRQEFRELQDAKLRALVNHAYAHVPYYKRLFDRHGIRPAQIHGAEDLLKIPTLTKEMIRANPDDFVSRSHHQRLLATGWTTGSTGTPLSVRRTMESIIFDKATLARQRRWAGIDIYARNAAVWGTVWSDVIVPRQAKFPPYWRFNAADNQMLFSYYHLSEATLPDFIAKLRAFRPAYIEAFPSTMLAFARFLNKTGEVVPVPAVFTSSEPLYNDHRKEIEAAFQTKLFDYYGHAERAVTAAECEYGNMHVNQEYGVLELLQGEAPVAPGERGEIVGTGLTNHGMPLIRYRTGDMSRFVAGSCPCGRETPLLGGIDGRIADFIRMPDGRMMPGDGVMEAFYGLDNVKESQVVQEEIDYILVKLVKDDQAAPVDTGLLRANLERCLGHDMRIATEFVDTLTDGDRLKKRWVVSKIGAGPA